MLMMSERVEDKFFVDTNDDSEEEDTTNLPVKRSSPADDNEWQFSHQLVLQKKNDEGREAPEEVTIQERVVRTLEAQGQDIKDLIASFEKDRPKDNKQEKLIEPSAKEHYDEEDLVQFTELAMSKPLVRACTELGYDHPTIIQRKAIPTILEGHDVLAHSVTGSGKTAAYLLPILQRYLTQR